MERFNPVELLWAANFVPLHVRISPLCNIGKSSKKKRERTGQADRLGRPPRGQEGLIATNPRGGVSGQKKNFVAKIRFESYIIRI